MSAATKALARTARRSIVRSPLRNSLIVGLIALLVALGTVVSISFESTIAQTADYRVGTLGQANTLITINPHPYPPRLSPDLERVGISPPALPVFASHDEERAFFEQRAEEAKEWFVEFERAGGVSQLREVVGPDALIHRRVFVSGERTSGPFGHYGGDETTLLIETNMSHPLAHGLLDLVEGRFPRSANEATIAVARTRFSDARVGDTLQVEGRELTIVGVAAMPSFNRAEFTIVMPAALDELAADPFGFDYRVRVVLSPAQRLEVLDAVENLVGFSVDVRTLEGAMLRQPSGEWMTVEFPADRPFRNYARSASERLIPHVFVALLGIQTTLVAAVAFVVSIRRRTQEFSQLDAIGADRKHLRKLVLIEAGWLAGLGALLGVVVGVTCAQVLLRTNVMADLTMANSTRHPVTLRWSMLGLASPVAAGVIAALAAAWWPARSVSPLHTAALLQARASRGPVDRATPLIAVALLMLALAGMYGLGRPGLGGVIILLGWVALIVMAFASAVLMINPILQLAGRIANRLPLLPRLAARHSARNRAQSWATVAALVAVLALPLVIGSATKGYPASFGAETAHLGGQVVTLSTHAAAIDEQQEPDAADQIEAMAPAFVTELDRMNGIVSQAPLEVASISLEALDPTSSRSESADASLWLATPELLEALDLPSSLIEELSPDGVLHIGSSWPLPERTSILSGTRDGHLVGHFAYHRGPAISTDLATFLVSQEFMNSFALATGPSGFVYVLENRLDVQAATGLRHIANEAWNAEHESLGSTVRGQDLTLSVNVTEGPSPRLVRGVALLVTIGIAGLIALITAALSAVELDNDVRTLVANGASPSIRRKLLGTQTWLQLTIASLFATPLALLVYNLVIRLDHDRPPGVVIPWSSVLSVTVIVPAVVATMIALLFRNGEPSVSRRTT